MAGHPLNANTSPILFLLFIFLSCKGMCPVSAQLSEKSLEHVAQKLGSELFRITKTASGYYEAEEGFRKMGVSVEKMEPLQAMQDIAGDVTVMMGKKVAAVKLLVENAEEMAKSATWIPNINITYYNAKEMGRNSTWFTDMDFVNDTRFNNEAVNLTYSTVHVPTNIYNKAPVILNGVHWSTRLDTFFRRNLQDDPTLKSQYFGSSEGFLRLFPGVKWSNPEVDRPDMYDCRLTNWYIRASSSPKDMIILVDISGSMTGIREEIARTTVKEIMNTLHEDDFFNIILMKEEAQFLELCSSGKLVQASEMTKRHYADLLKSLETENIANYTEAFTMAFQALNSSGDSNAAECNKAIMVVSDGAPETFDDLFKAMNPEKRVRIFTYVIGREVTVYEEMTNIACHNRGFVTHVSTMADVRDDVESCISVFSRPLGMSISQNSEHQFVTWSNHETRHWNSIGMVMTVAQPVFNRSESANRKGSLIGVVGIDVPIVDIKRLMKPYNWAVGSYIFGTNHNGHVIFHPYWRLMTKKTTLPRHSHNEVDLGQVEFPTDMDLNETSGGNFSLPLRKLMIDQETGHLTMKVMRQMDDRKRIYEREYNYYYAGVTDTQLSIALAIPAGTGRPNSHLLRPKGSLSLQKFKSGAILADNCTQLRLHPDWAYCNVTLSNGSQELFSYLYPSLEISAEDRESEETDRATVKCDMEIVESLLFDLTATQPAVAAWSLQSDLHKKYSIETSFLMTRAGATRWQDFVYQSDQLDLKQGEAAKILRVRQVLEDEEIQSNEAEEEENEGDEKKRPAGPAEDNFNSTERRHFFEQYSRAVDESFYERTVTSHDDMTVTISLNPGVGHADLASFMLSVPVFVGESSEKTAPAAITGIMMKVKRLRQLLVDISEETCSGSSQCFSCHSSSVSCFLVDESGYVVVSTRYADDRGKFFGALHGEIMEALIDHKIYMRYKLHDYQGLCQEISQFSSKSAGFSFRPWLGGILAGIRLLTSHTLTILSSVFWQAVGAESDYYSYEGSSMDEEPSDNSSHAKSEWSRPSKPPFMCDMKYDLFHSKWTQLRSLFSVQCAGDCSKTVAVYKVSTTNMLLIAMDKVRTCPCSDSAFSTAPEEIIYPSDGPGACQKYIAVPYRRRPADCFPYHPDEDASDCGSGSSSLIANSILLFFSLMVFGLL